MTYLIWIERNKIWLSQLNCCADFLTKELRDSTVWNDLQLNKDRLFSSKFKEDYITVHNDFWHLKVLPTFTEEIRIFDYYFDEDHKYHEFNQKLYANKFRKILQKAIIENKQ